MFVYIMYDEKILNWLTGEIFQRYFKNNYFFVQNYRIWMVITIKFEAAMVAP